MKAIETSYDGYRFRSRVEARWAVFFNALGMKYEYEKEGFDLDGTWYLPDFWLPDLECWIEIKGQHPTKEDQQKIVALTAGGNYLGIIRSGTPDPVENEGYAYWASRFIGFQVFVECVTCGTIGILAKHPELSVMMRRLRCPCWEANGFSTDTPRLLAAYDAARSARFEHGETPQLPEYSNEDVVISTGMGNNLLTESGASSLEAVCDADKRYFDLNPEKSKYVCPFNEQEVRPEILVQWKTQFGRYPYSVEVRKTGSPNIRLRTFLISEDGKSTCGFSYDADTPEAQQVLRESSQKLYARGQQVLKEHDTRQARKQVNQRRKQKPNKRKR